MKQGSSLSMFAGVGRQYLVPFLLVTACFAVWGFSNNATTPMVNAFSKIFRISNSEATLVPVAYYMGYFLVAFPAAWLITRHSYKWGVMVGLAIFAAGTLLFVPARSLGAFYPFLGTYFIMTCGLAFLETSCNPYIYSMGSEATAIRRVNAAQAFNPLGALVGMYVAMGIHQHMSPLDKKARLDLPFQQFEIIKSHDLTIVTQPYFFIGAIVVVLLIFIALTQMPETDTPAEEKNIGTAIRELARRRNYREGVLAELCYVGAQVTCWTYIIQYGVRVFVAEGMEEQAAEVMAQRFNLLAMLFFCVGRFVCTWLLRWFSPGRMLSVMAIVGMCALFGAIMLTNRTGLYCLVIVSGSMSLMFPTIYGVALRGIGENIKYASAGLIMAIVGGSIFPLMQVFIIDARWTFLGLPSTNVSFFIPLVCLGVVAWYGHRAYVRHYITHDYDS